MAKKASPAKEMRVRGLSKPAIVGQDMAAPIEMVLMMIEIDAMF